MTDNDLFIAVAELDGFKWYISDSGIAALLKLSSTAFWTECPQPDNVSEFNIEAFCPPYLTSRDAIVPVIEKCWKEEKPTYLNAITFREKLSDVQLSDQIHSDSSGAIRISLSEFDVITTLLATPRQLCIALLKATNKWKEI